MTTKVCRICGIEKPVSEFYRNHGNGLRGDCKPCNSARVKAWFRNSGRASDAVRLKKLRKRGVTIVEPVHRREVFSRAGGRCQSCGATLTFRGGERWDVDHIAPVAAGGVHAYSNVQALCVPCHKAKTSAEAGGGGAGLPGSRRFPRKRPAV